MDDDLWANDNVITGSWLCLFRGGHSKRDEVFWQAVDGIDNKDDHGRVLSVPCQCRKLRPRVCLYMCQLSSSYKACTFAHFPNLKYNDKHITMEAVKRRASLVSLSV